MSKRIDHKAATYLVMYPSSIYICYCNRFEAAIKKKKNVLNNVFIC